MDEDIRILRERSHKLSNELASLKGRVEVNEMKNGKGNSWTLWAAGIISSLIILAITTIGNAVISNDKESRARDSDIEKRTVQMCEAQTKINQEILVALASIKTDMVYIKRAVEK